MVDRSTVGTAIGRPHSNSYCARLRTRPPVMTPTSALVPPMSSVKTSGEPVASAKCLPAISPPARPERIRLTGWRVTASAATWPPLDFRKKQRERIPRSSSPRLQADRELADEPAQVRVDDDRVAALVLAPDRRDLAGDGDRHVRQLAPHGVGQELLVPRIDVGEQQVDGDADAARRLGVAGADEGHGGRDVLLRQGSPHGAVVEDALVDAEAVAAQHVGRRLGPLQVVQALAVDALDERDVLQARRGQVDGALAAALQQAVGGDGGAEDEEPDLVQGDAQAAHALQHRGGRVARRGRHLDLALAAVPLVDGDQVGEGAAGVDADAERLLRGPSTHSAATSSSTSRIVEAISAMSFSSSTNGGEMCRFGPVISRISTPRSVIGPHTRWAVA